MNIGTDIREDAMPKKQGLIVISLFDGISCGLTALKRAGIKVSEYHAFENDKYAIQIAKKNHPEIIHHGEINFMTDFSQFKGADLLIGGSPCQGFSLAGKGLNFKDPRSQLFFEFVRARNEIKPKHFLLENVKMKKEIQDAISKQMKCKPILINSALVSAQNRKRLYWCNWKVGQPEDKGIFLKDIIEESDNPEFQSDGWHKWWHKNKEFQLKKRYSIITNNEQKAITMTARQYASYNGNFVELEKSHYSDRCKKQIKKNSKNPEQKAVSVCTNSNLTGSGVNIITYDDKLYRKLTVSECCRLQTLPDDYCDSVSSTQAYKALGNGWTVSVISHLFKGIPTKHKVQFDKKSKLYNLKP